MKQVCSVCLYSRRKQNQNGIVCVKDIKHMKDVGIEDWCSSYNDKPEDIKAYGKFKNK